MSKSIALFGGSFNPPHIGHYEIARRVARRKTIDEVWILPVWRHPFGKKMADFSARLNLCRRFFKDLGRKVKVKDLERRLGGRSYTIRMVRFLKKKYPRSDFQLILGADAYGERKKWKDFEAIKKEVGLIVFPRGKKSPIPDVSSTEIRRIPLGRHPLTLKDERLEILRMKGSWSAAATRRIRSRIQQVRKNWRN